MWSNRTFFSNTIVQRVPKAPVDIDLPDLSTTDAKKRSHSDFYNKPATEDSKEAEPESLIKEKLSALKGHVKLDAASSGYTKMSDQPYSKFQAIFALE